jgi:hemoglobin
MTTKIPMKSMKFDQANLHQRLMRIPAVLLLLSLYIPQAQAQKQDDQRGIGIRRAGQVNTLPEKNKRYALIIGVDKYADGSITPLDGASNDAKALANALIRYAGFAKDQVILLASDQPPERQPTRGEILQRLSNLRGAAPKDGLLLVAFAGHGIERNDQAYLLPSDARIHGDIELLQETSISVTRMKEAIRAVGVGQVVLLLDACRNDPVSGRSDSINPLSNAYTRGFNFDVINSEVTAFATIYATEVGQRAYEYREKRQGYFTWALVEGMQGAAANERGEVTLSGLIRHVQESVPKRVRLDLGGNVSQKPFAVVEGYRADDLVIAAPGVRQPDNSSDAEIAYWNSIKDSSNPTNFRAYLDDFPQGRFRRLAENRLRELEAPAIRPSAGDPASAPPNTSSPAPPRATGTLYERLGGRETIFAMVDDFFMNILGDSRINKKFAKSDALRLVANMRDFICVASGGPCQYYGLDMKKAHRNMGTTAGEFNAMIENLVKTLDKFRVQEKERNELLTALARLRGEIVESESSATGGELPGKFRPAPPLGVRR